VTEDPVGFVGLGHMGGALAQNLVAAGFPLVTYDPAGAANSPAQAVFVPSVAEVARRASVVVLSLPDGAASEQVAQEVANTESRRVTHLVDTSTIGLVAAGAVDSVLADAGIEYVDAPVSGGIAGARARSLMVMYAGGDAACAAVASVLAGLSDRGHRVGERPGMGQAMKLANNFLSAMALATTSEAIAFGQSVGLEIGTMLDVLNSSSGQNTATSDKFPNHVVTGHYGAGFTNALMAKDARLFVDAMHSRQLETVFGELATSVWERFAADQPGADFTRIFPYVSGQLSGSESLG
jgi:3-hydroxyisobutyrate dehydrogenase-like beta-hydroxyacid dehydrogenase